MCVCWSWCSCCSFGLAAILGLVVFRCGLVVCVVRVAPLGVVATVGLVVIVVIIGLVGLVVPAVLLPL